MTERRHVSPVTCTADGLAHLVSDTALAATQRGTYTAICGHCVVAAPMVSPVGRPCEGCAARVGAAQRSAPARGRHRPGSGRWHPEL